MFLGKTKQNKNKTKKQACFVAFGCGFESISYSRWIRNHHRSKYGPTK